MSDNTPRQKAAVLVPVYRDSSGKLILVLVRRTEGDVHGGQIAFPGGKMSDKDRSLLDTALRETEEEVGLIKSQVKILKQLPNVSTQTSRFEITPFLGKIVRPAIWKLDNREIAEVIECPVNELLRPEVYGEEMMIFPGWEGPRTVPFYKVGKYQLWGATYRILGPILNDLTSGKWKV